MRKYEICYRDNRSIKTQYKQFTTEHDAFAFIYINQPMEIKAINIIVPEPATSA